MPTWRKLHTKTIDSQDVADMPDDFTRLAWLMLPLVADSEGRMIDNNLYLRSKMFPLRPDVTAEMVEQALAWYAKRGMIERYEVADRRYIQITKFHEYQGKTDREAASVIPEKVIHARKSKSRVGHELVTTHSPLEEIRGEESKSSADAPAPKAISPTVAIQAAYENLLGEKLTSADWVKQEGAAAKAIGDKYTVEQLQRAYRHYKAQPFWADKRLSLHYLNKNMGSLLAGGGGNGTKLTHGAGPWGARPSTNGNGGAK